MNSVYRPLATSFLTPKSSVRQGSKHRNDFEPKRSEKDYRIITLKPSGVVPGTPEVHTYM